MILIFYVSGNPFSLILLPSSSHAFFSFRATATMSGTPEEVANTILNFKNPKWDSLLHSMEVVERIDENTVVCRRYNMYACINTKV